METTKVLIRIVDVKTGNRIKTIDNSDTATVHVLTGMSELTIEGTKYRIVSKETKINKHFVLYINVTDDFSVQ